MFYIEPGPLPGQSIAYFGPDVRVPLPQPALSVNMDAHTNVESLSFSLDGLQKRIEIITVLDPVTGRIPIPVPMPEINVFKPPLGLRPTPPAKIVFDRDGGRVDLRRSAQAGDRAGHPVVGGRSPATARLNVLRYGQVLRARTLVGRARRRADLRWAVLRGQRDPQHQARANTNRASICRATA